MRVKAARLNVMVDLLAFEAIETDAGGVVEAALDATRGLAGRLRRTNHRLALDETVELPERRISTRTIPQIKLWD